MLNLVDACANSWDTPCVWHSLRPPSSRAAVVPMYELPSCNLNLPQWSCSVSRSALRPPAEPIISLSDFRPLWFGSYSNRARPVTSADALFRLVQILGHDLARGVDFLQVTISLVGSWRCNSVDSQNSINILSCVLAFLGAWSASWRL